MKFLVNKNKIIFDIEMSQHIKKNRFEFSIQIFKIINKKLKLNPRRDTPIQTLIGSLGMDAKFLQGIVNGVISGLINAGYAALNLFLSNLFANPSIQTLLGFLGK